MSEPLGATHVMNLLAVLCLVLALLGGVVAGVERLITETGTDE